MKKIGFKLLLFYIQLSFKLIEWQDESVKFEELGIGQTDAEFKSQFIIDVAISEVGNSFYCLREKQIKSFAKNRLFLLFF